MKVKDLIEELKEFDQNLEVYFYNENQGNSYLIGAVAEITTTNPKKEVIDRRVELLIPNKLYEL